MRRRKRSKGYRALARDLNETVGKLQKAAEQAATKHPHDRRLNELITQAVDEVDEAATCLLWMGNR